jgi:hypothetical protein
MVEALIAAIDGHGWEPERAPLFEAPAEEPAAAAIAQIDHDDPSDARVAPIDRDDPNDSVLQDKIS